MGQAIIKDLMNLYLFISSTKLLGKYNYTFQTRIYAYDVPSESTILWLASYNKIGNTVSYQLAIYKIKTY